MSTMKAPWEGIGRPEGWPTHSCAIIYGNCNCWYEVENLVRLFLGGTSYCYGYKIYKDDGSWKVDERMSDYHRVNDSSVFVEVTDHLHIEVKLCGKETVDRTAPLPEDQSKEAVEYALCSLLYDTLHEVSGYSPPWGMLTGVRPVQKVIQLLDAGKTPEEASATLQEKYRISDDRIQMAVDTARVQYPLLPHDPREISFYVSIPFCPTRCSYCSFISQPMNKIAGLVPAYIEKLCEEIAWYGALIRKHRLRVTSVYIGGGTPTAITAEQLRTVMQAIADHIDMTDTCEYTVEAGRPDTITEDKLRVIKEMGVGRISVNPQTMQDSVLEAIGRRHTAQQTVDAFRLARSMGFEDINMDLIAGLPSDTYEGFADTLRQVMELDPDSITVHTLTIKRAGGLYYEDKEWMQNMEISDIERMAALSAELLPANGWRPYYLYRQKNTRGNLENVGYAKPGKENLYNILIMDETQTILAAGCAASTKLVSWGGDSMHPVSYKQPHDITRVMNYKLPDVYIRQFDKKKKKKQQICAFFEKDAEF